jgi:hypothetical protein
MKCQCGIELKLPAIFIGYTETQIPIALFACVCGIATSTPISAMRPYTVEKAATWPPASGQWAKQAEGGVSFCCPVCKGIAGVSPPVHEIGAEGEVTPSYVCAYGCGFHSHITLKDWSEPSRQP